MKRLIFICVTTFVFWCNSSINCSAQSKFNVFLDYHYTLGLVEKGDWYDISRSGMKMYGNSLRISGMYNLTPKISLGAGIGSDRYENPGYNTIPVFAAFHYAPLSNLPKAYAFTNLGYALNTGQTVNPGFLWDLGIGYKMMLRKHFGLNFQFGYNLKQVKFDYWDWNTDNIFSSDVYRSSLSFGFGLIF